MGIGNLGFGELMIILVIVLVLFGAKRVPEIGASIGKGIREFKKATSDVDRDVRGALSDSPRAADRLPPAESIPTRADEAEPARPEPKRLL
jgi:sec-independent protein translocase protein TatA